MNLVSDWKNAWRWYSIHAIAITAAAPVAMTAAENYLGCSFPLWVKGVVAGVLFITGVVGRLVPQEKTHVGNN